MDNNPYSDWIKLYDEDVEHTWNSQIIELRKPAMLLKAFENECKRIQKNMEVKLKMYEKEMQNMQEHKNETSIEGKENQEIIHDISMNSPEVFICNSSPILNDTTNIDNDYEKCTPDESKSPKINRLHKLLRPRKLKPQNHLNYSTLKLLQSTPKNINNIQKINEDLVDSTIIQTTPDIQNIQKTSRHNKIINKLKKSKTSHSSNNSTITQMFSHAISSMNNEDGSIDATYCPYQPIVNRLSNPINITEKDITKVSEDDVKEIDLTSSGTVSCVQEVEVVDPSSEITVDVKKSTKMENPKMDAQKFNFVYKEPTVRGKERLKLQGWECLECQKFYRGLDLNTIETKKLLNKCSRHRSKFKPHDYTPKGFWDMNFPPTQD